MQFSKELEEAIYGDKAVLRYLDICKKAFEDGEKAALFGIVCLCARYQAVIPEWAVDQLLQIENYLGAGTLADFNEAFGWAGDRKNARQKKARQAHATQEVLEALLMKRLAGGSLNADDIFAEIASEMQAKGSKINRRDVEDIYKNKGKFIKEIPRDGNATARYGLINTTIPNTRRYGRAILKD